MSWQVDAVMPQDSLLDDIRSTMEFFERGPGSDPYYREKVAAKRRLLAYCISRIACEELRAALIKKAAPYLDKSV